MIFSMEMNSRKPSRQQKEPCPEPIAKLIREAVLLQAELARLEGISEEEINLHLGCFVEIRAESNEVFETTVSNLILDYLNFEVIRK